MKFITCATGFILLSMMVTLGEQRRVFTLDENSICHIKKSCLDCLLLSHCSWCENKNRCFSKQLVKSQEYCENNSTIHHHDYKMSLEENAECSCNKGKMKSNCFELGGVTGEECSGRGECVCGRCFCNPNPDPEHPTKVVMGEYCEYDNFSCDGPKCNEGPYSINEQEPIYENEADAVIDIDEPSEE